MKTVVVYYSKTGVGKKVAELVAEKTNAELYRLQPTTEYDDDMWKAWDQAQAEMASNKMPNLEGELPSLAKYDRIIVGGPVWGHSLSNPIRAYLEQTDFQGKMVSSYWTYYDHDEQYEQVFMQNLKNATYKTGVNLTMPVLDNQNALNKKVDSLLKN